MSRTLANETESKPEDLPLRPFGDPLLGERDGDEDGVKPVPVEASAE